MRVNLPLTLPGTPGYIGWVAQRTKIEANKTGEKNTLNIMMPNDILLYS